MLTETVDYSREKYTRKCLTMPLQVDATAFLKFKGIVPPWQLLKTWNLGQLIVEALADH